MITRSKALEQLNEQARQIPSTIELLSLLTNLEQQSRGMPDAHTLRSSALIASGVLEFALTEAIHSKFFVKDEKLKRQIFDGDHEHEGIIGTTHTKNLIAYALGVYGENTRQDINVVRKLRNIFAHAKNDSELSPDNLKTVCKFHAVETRNKVFEIQLGSKHHPINQMFLFLEMLVPFLLLHASTDWDDINRQQWRQVFS
jgi:hypothetical protein